MSAPSARYRVVVRESGTDLPFADIDTAFVEWSHRCRKGQRACLHQWLDATIDEPGAWDCLCSWTEYDDMASEQMRRFDENPHEDRDDELRDTASPR
jgi:hypothetical protein